LLARFKQHHAAGWQADFDLLQRVRFPKRLVHQTPESLEKLPLHCIAVWAFTPVRTVSLPGGHTAVNVLRLGREKSRTDGPSFQRKLFALTVHALLPLTP
jgi:hypothetical protein